MWSQCFKETSLPIVPQLFNDNNSSISKVVWIGIFLSSCAIFGFHSSLLILKYMSHETAVSVHLDGIKFIPPDIYICNSNPYSKYRIDYLDLINDTKFERFKQIYESLDVEKNYYMLSLSANQIIPGFTSEETFNLLSNRDYNDFLTESINVGDSVYSIKDIFVQVPHSSHFSCYKLKSEFKELIHRKQFFDFALYTDKQDFFSNLSPEIANDNSDTSHTIYFTSPGTYPHYNAQRVNIEPGTKVSIQVTMEFYNKINLNRKPCLEKDEFVTYRNEINESDPKSYLLTPTDCAYTLMEQDSIKEGQCVWSVHPIEESLWRSGKAPPCNSRGPWSYVGRDAADMYLYKCINVTSCKQPVYRLQVEETRMQGINIAMYLDAYKHKSPEPPLYKEFMNTSSSSVLPDKFKDSIVKISVYAPNRFSTKWQEYLAYELKDLLSDVGGILGFYIGVSVVTCLEILGYASRAVWKRKDTRIKYGAQHVEFLPVLATEQV